MSKLDTRAEELIAAASNGDGPTPAEKARLRAAVLARVGAAAAVGAGVAVLSAKAKVGAAAVSAAETGAGVGTAIVAKASVLTLALKAAAVVGVVGVVAGIGLVTTTYVTPRAHSSVPGAPVPLVVESQPHTPPRVVDITSGTVATPEGHAQPVEPPVPAAPAATSIDPRVPSTPSHAAGAVSESFEAETAALAGALALLRDGRADQALASLRDQDVRYFDGALGEERAATQIDALCMLGRAADARALAERFLVKHPRSLLAARVQASCSGVAPR
jgi:hypothetical protein